MFEFSLAIAAVECGDELADGDGLDFRHICLTMWRCLCQFLAPSSSHGQMMGLYGSSLLGAFLFAGSLGEKPS